MNATPSPRTPGRRKSKQIVPAPLPPVCIQRLDAKSRRTIERAVKILEDSAVYRTDAMSTPGAVRQYLVLKMAHLEREEFLAIWLDAQNRVIDFDVLFTGTLRSTVIYPREIIKRALASNAASVIVAHNHPSGIRGPSVDDLIFTKSIKDSLALIDVKLLDHFIVCGTAQPVSFAELGQL